jgi:CCR4-NOT transcriptional regulation complex NOT5 subunit
MQEFFVAFKYNLKNNISKMAEIVVKIPKELEEDFKKIDPLLLELAVQRLIKEKLEEFVEVEKMLSKSKLTEKEALELGRKVNKALAKRYEKLR